MDKYTLKIRQEYPLELKIRLSNRRITDFYEYNNGDVYISFSGGKDSTVLLDLVRKQYPNVPAVFVDTGLEYPELKKFVKEQNNIVVLRPDMPFNKVIEEYGYPVISKEVSEIIDQSRRCLIKNDGTYIYRLQKLLGTAKDKNGNKSIYCCEKWKFLLNAPFKISNQCCNVMKKRPLHKYFKETGKSPFVATLAQESRLRMQQYLKNGCNNFNSNFPISTPLAFWTEQDILKYLYENNLSYASVYGDIKINEKGQYYTTGLKRTGCMFCMYGCHLEKSPNRFQQMQLTHFKQWDYCINKLGIGKVLDYINVPYST